MWAKSPPSAVSVYQPEQTKKNRSVTAVKKGEMTINTKLSGVLWYK